MIWLDKKLQVMAYLVSLDNYHMERRRLLNLIYMVDRKTYVERGCPIVGGRLFAMDSGPANYDIYSIMITNNYEEYFKYFENEGYEISLKNEPDYLDLSQYEENKLKEVHKTFHNMDCWELAKETQKFQEWKDAWNPNIDSDGPIWIPLENVLRVVGFNEKHTQHIICDIESHERICHSLSVSDCKGDCI